MQLLLIPCKLHLLHHHYTTPSDMYTCIYVIRLSSRTYCGKPATLFRHVLFNIIICVDLLKFFIPENSYNVLFFFWGVGGFTGCFVFCLLKNQPTCKHSHIFFEYIFTFFSQDTHPGTVFCMFPLKGVAKFSTQ